MRVICPIILFSHLLCPIILSSEFLWPIIIFIARSMSNNYFQWYFLLIANALLNLKLYRSDGIRNLGHTNSQCLIWKLVSTSILSTRNQLADHWNRRVAGLNTLIVFTNLENKTLCFEPLRIVYNWRHNRQCIKRIIKMNGCLVEILNSGNRWNSSRASGYPKSV